MRNLFDQYEIPENRITHALATCLAEDPILLRRFVRWATGSPPPAGRLRIVQQQIPGEPVTRVEDEQDGLPDAWIYSDDRWALLIESKVQAPVLAAQLRRHMRMAQRQGFTSAKLLVLSAGNGERAPRGVLHRGWSEVYGWALRERRKRPWSGRLAEYLEIAETRMVARQYLTDGMLTMFNGFPFDEERPYTYREAKRLLNLSMDLLRKSRPLAKLGMDPSGTGRPAITGREGKSVWDFLPLRVAKGRKDFVRHPHLTLSVHRDHLEAFVTIPHGAESQYRRRLLALGREGFIDLAAELCRSLRPVLRLDATASPRLYALQRHYKSQRSDPVTDARLDFDLRTVLPAGHGRVKGQPQWVAAVHDALLRKRSNLQLGAGVRFEYGGSRICSPAAIQMVEQSWLGCKPLLDALGASGAGR